MDETSVGSRREVLEKAPRSAGEEWDMGNDETSTSIWVVATQIFLYFHPENWGR